MYSWHQQTSPFYMASPVLVPVRPANWPRPSSRASAVVNFHEGFAGIGDPNMRYSSDIPFIYHF